MPIFPKKYLQIFAYQVYDWSHGGIVNTVTKPLFHLPTNFDNFDQRKQLKQD